MARAHAAQPLSAARVRQRQRWECKHAGSVKSWAAQRGLSWQHVYAVLGALGLRCAEDLYEHGYHAAWDAKPRPGFRREEGPDISEADRAALRLRGLVERAVDETVRWHEQGGSVTEGRHKYWHKDRWLPHERDPVTREILPGALPLGI